MSICDSSIESKVATGKIVVEVSDKHPLVMLATTLPWLDLYKIILPNLKKNHEEGFLARRKETQGQNSPGCIYSTAALQLIQRLRDKPMC